MTNKHTITYQDKLGAMHAFWVSMDGCAVWTITLSGQHSTERPFQHVLEGGFATIQAKLETLRALDAAL